MVAIDQKYLHPSKLAIDDYDDDDDDDDDIKDDVGDVSGDSDGDDDDDDDAAAGADAGDDADAGRWVMDDGRMAMMIFTTKMLLMIRADSRLSPTHLSLPGWTTRTSPDDDSTCSWYFLPF